jgi:hypothetical protein
MCRNHSTAFPCSVVSSPPSSQASDQKRGKQVSPSNEPGTYHSEISGNKLS